MPEMVPVSLTPVQEERTSRSCRPGTPRRYNGSMPGPTKYVRLRGGEGACQLANGGMALWQFGKRKNIWSQVIAFSGVVTNPLLAIARSTVLSTQAVADV